MSDSHGDALADDQSATAAPGAPFAALQALQTLTELFLEHARGGATPLPTHFAELMDALLPRLTVQERAGIAVRLAHSPVLPADVAARLVADAPEVAAPLLRQSPVLTESLLLEVAGGGDERRARCVAARADLSERVRAELARRGDRMIAEEMLSGPPAPIEGEVSELLAATPDLSARAAERLVLWGELSLTSLGRLFWSADSATRRIIIERAARRGAPAQAETESSSGTALELGSSLFAAAATRRPDEMAGLLADALGLSDSLSLRVVEDPTGEALLTACRAAGVGASQITSLMILMPTGDDAIERQETLRTFAGLAEKLSPPAAASLLSTWSDGAAAAPRPVRHRAAVTAAERPQSRGLSRPVPARERPDTLPGDATVVPLRGR